MPSISLLRKHLSLLVGAGMMAASGAAASATWVYVSNADSQDITVMQLDRAAGQLKTVATVPVGGTAMPMVVSRDKKFLYVASRSQPGVLWLHNDSGGGAELFAKRASGPVSKWKRHIRPLL